MLCLKILQPKNFTQRQLATLNLNKISQSRDVNPGPRISEQTENPSPEIRASFASKLFFSWFGSVIRAGWKKPLTSADVYDLPPADRCASVVEDW